MGDEGRVKQGFGFELGAVEESICFMEIVLQKTTLRQLYPTIQLVNLGVYVGTDAQTEDYLSEEDMDEIYSFGKKLARTVYGKGYYGNLSIDAIKIKEKLIHLVEINNHHLFLHNTHCIINL